MSNLLQCGLKTRAAKAINFDGPLEQPKQEAIRV